MTKGEIEAYNRIMGELNSLIAFVEYYCRDYDCGDALIKACKSAKEAVAQARKDFNKGKRKKMKEITIDKTVKETWYEASDGTRFRAKEECKRYEESAKCVLLTKYKYLVIDSITEYDLHQAGSEEYTLDIVKITKEEDIDTIMQLYALYNYSQSYRQYDDKFRDMCIKALKENDYIFIARDSCGDDIFYIQYSKNELIAHINSVCNERALA